MAVWVWSAAGRWFGATEPLEYRIAAEEFSRSRYDAAYEHARRPVALDRGSARSLRLFLVAAGLAGQDTAALEELEQRGNQRKLTPELRLGKAELLFVVRQYSEAEAEALALLRDRTADARAALTASLVQLDACERWSEFSMLSTAGSPSARIAQGRCAVARGAVDEAVHLYDEVSSRVGVGVALAWTAKMRAEVLRSTRSGLPKCGALIVDLQEGEASSKGLRPRDILVAADGDAIRVAADVNRARIRGASTQQIRWTVWRSGRIVHIMR